MFRFSYHSQHRLLSKILIFRLRYRLAIIGLSFFSAAFGILSPFFQKEFVDTLMGLHTFGGGFSHMHPLGFMGLAFFCYITAQGLTALGLYWGAREALHVQRDLSETLYTKTLGLRSDSLKNRPIGEIVSIYATDVQGATAIIEQSLPTGASIFFPLILAPLGVYLITEIPLIPTLIVMGSVVFLNIALSLRQSRFFFRFKQLGAERTGMVNEWVQNIRALRILGWVSAFENRIFEKRREETHNRILLVTNGQMMSSTATSINFFISLAAVATLVWLMPEKVSPGRLLSLLWILGVFLSRPFRQMPWFLTFILDAITSLRRVENFLDLENNGGATAPTARIAPVSVQTQAPSISVRDLNLAIGSSSLLQHIDLDIAAGEFVAVVGEVGSGKSLLLLSLIGETGAHFQSFSIAGHSVDEMSYAERRSYFALVPQEGFVMSASLRENIGFEYGVSEHIDPAAIQSLKLAQLDLKNESFEQGLETEIGERGVNLSGGQKQRVNLARADFYDRPIVLLDDCLSAVDVDTERRLIFDLISGRWRNKTRILVTHRLSVLHQVDRIYFLEDGALSDCGTYGELMSRSHSFRRFALSSDVAESPQKIAGANAKECLEWPRQ